MLEYKYGKLNEVNKMFLYWIIIVIILVKFSKLIERSKISKKRINSIPSEIKYL